jgi:hypothetical protein
MFKSFIAAIVALLIAPFGVFHHGVAASPTQHTPPYAHATSTDADTGETASLASFVRRISGVMAAAQAGTPNNSSGRSSDTQSQVPGNVTIKQPTLFGRGNPPYVILISGTAPNAYSVIIAVVSSSYTGNEDYDSLHLFPDRITNTNQLAEAFVFPPIPVIRTNWAMTIDPSTKWYYGVYRILVFDVRSHALLASSAPTKFPPPTPLVFPTNAYSAPQ